MASGSQKRKAPGPDTYTDDVWKHTKGTVDKKLQRSEPYRIFLSPISCDTATHTEELTLSFPELLDKSLGVLTGTLHINFMVELGWLLAQYHITDQRGKRMTLVYGRCDEDLNQLIAKKPFAFQNIKHVKVINENAFGHHHSKVSMFAYADGSLRVVVMSANLREEDWNEFTQGIWVSPKFPLKKKDNTSDDSETNFKKDILRYLKSYNQNPLSEWIEKVEKVDFSQANVFFIPSVPGKHTEQLWGHLYLKSILKKHASLPYRVPSEWPIIAQCSSLGSLGATEKEWLTSEFVDSLSASTYSNTSSACNGRVPFNLVYPSEKNVLSSWNGPLGAGCLPYGKKVHEKQLWLKNYMCLWESHSRKRSKAMPHIKTYCRISSCCTDMSWFLLTSANLSKAAWGRKLKSKDQSNYILANEAGVLFLPKFVTGSNTFSLVESETNKSLCLSLPFDLPLTEYSKTDVPWVVEF